MKAAGLIVVGVWLFFVSCWVVNAYRLTECDFEAPYKCEAIHAIGLLGPAAAVTVWYNASK